MRDCRQGLELFEALLHESLKRAAITWQNRELALCVGDPRITFRYAQKD